MNVYLSEEQWEHHDLVLEMMEEEESLLLYLNHCWMMSQMLECLSTKEGTGQNLEPREEP